MKKRRGAARHRSYLLGSLALLAAVIASQLASAQVVRDGSIGPAGPVAGGDDSLGGRATYLIEAEHGRRHGGSLFHSFSEFSVGENETAAFDAPKETTGIHHVVSRVTGGSTSEIDGTIRSTIEGAALWLLNPAGVAFGEGAVLDVPAGFHASTAQGLRDENTGAVFEAKPNGAVPMMGIASPVEFGFLDGGEITVDGSLLRVGDGAELSLTAAEVRVEQGSVLEASSGAIRLEGDTISVEGGLSTAGAASGEISIAGNRVELGTTAVLDADYENNTPDPARVHIEASESVQIRGLVTASALDSDSYGETSGEITIEGRTVEIGSLGVVTASSDGVAHGGRVTLRGGSVRVEGEVLAESRFDRSGEIRITATQDVEVGEHGRVSTASNGLFAGKGGEITLSGASVSVAGEVTAGGDEGGTVRLEASERVTTTEGSLISAAGTAKEKDGTIEIDAPERDLGGVLDPGTCPPSCPAGPEPPDPGPPAGVVVLGRVILDDGAAVAAGADPLGRNATYLITANLGHQDGHNLFHAFKYFSVGTGETAAFTAQNQASGALPIDHVVARVTGGEKSQVDGVLRTTIPGAALWLLNPSGWVFGQSARLDVQGALHVGASGLLDFDDGRSFWDQRSGESLAAGGEISIDGVLKVPEGEALELAGGSLTIGSNGVLDASSTRVGGGTIRLLGGDVTHEGTVRADSHYEDGGIVQITGDVIGFGAESKVLADAETLGIGGQIEIQGRTVTVGGTVSASSRFDDAIRKEDYDTQPDDDDDVIAIEIEAGEVLSISGTVRADSDSAGNAGEIHLTAPTIAVGGSVSASSLLDDGGTIVVRAREGTVRVMDGAEIRADSRGGFEEGGEIEIEAKDFRVEGDGMEPDGTVSVAGAREAGSLSVRARTIDLTGDLLAESSEGRGGSISFTGVEQLTTGSRSLISTKGMRNGTIAIRSTGTMPLPTEDREGRMIFQTLQECAGNACAAGVNMGKVVLEGGVPVSTGIDENGDPADYLITANLGSQKGGNLFFDFESFSLGDDETAETATFTGEANGADRIRHVVARVTGGESVLHGMVRSTIEGASLWLLNKAGWLLGDETQLDVDGGLHIGAADGLSFSGGGVFGEAEGAPLDFVFAESTGKITVDDGVELGADEQRVATLELAAAGDVAVGVDTQLITRGGALRLYADQGDVLVGFETDQRPDEPGAELATAGGGIELEAANGDVRIGPDVRLETAGVDIDARAGDIGARAESSLALDASARMTAPGAAIDLAGSNVSILGTVDASSASGAGGSINLSGADITLEGRLSAISELDPARDGSVAITVQRPGSLERDGASLLGRVTIDGNRLGGTGAVVLEGGDWIGPGTDSRGLYVDYLIEAALGELDGRNLIYDFDTFRIGEGEAASFTSLANEPTAIENIVARVPFGGSSRIEGLVRTTIPGAALWLLNPSGWVFGSSARLDVQGGFHVGATHTDVLRFDEGPLSLANVDLGAGLDEGDPELGSISVERGALLRLRDEQVLELTASGDVDVEELATLESREGEVSVRGRNVTVAGTVSADGIERADIGPDGDGGQVEVEAVDRVSISQNGRASASGGERGSGGRVSLRGRDLTVEAEGLVIAEGGMSPDSGDEFDGFGGEIRIVGRSASIQAGGALRVPGRENRAGRIAVRTDRAQLAGLVSARARPDGDGGRITISGSDIRVLETGVIDADGFESGSGGVVDLRGATIDVVGVTTEMEGEEPVDVVGSVSAGGNAGGFVRLAGDALEIDGFVEATGFRSSGTLRLFGGRGIRLFEHAFVSASGGLATERLASQTSVLLQSAGFIEVDGGTVSASGLPPFVVDGEIEDNNARLFVRPSSPGRVAVEAERLLVVDGGRVDSTSFGMEQAGSIDVRVGSLEIVGAESGFQSGTRGRGPGGDIRVRADSIDLRDGASLSTSSMAFSEQQRYEEIVGRRFDRDSVDFAFRPLRPPRGGAGSIEIVAPQVMLSGGSSFEVSAEEAAGGNITVRGASLLSLVKGSRITASVEKGEGGNIELMVPGFLRLAGRSEITASAEVEGKGGSITISANGLVSDRPILDAIRATGTAETGTVDIDAPDADLTASLVALPSSVLDAASLMRGRCAEQSTAEARGTFVERLDRLPPAPDGPLMAWPGSAGGAPPTSSSLPPGRVGAFYTSTASCN